MLPHFFFFFFTFLVLILKKINKNWLTKCYNFEEEKKAAKCLSLYSISLFLIITESLTPRKRLLPDKSAYLNSLIERCLSLYFSRKGLQNENKTVTLLWPSISGRCPWTVFFSPFLYENLLSL